MSKYPTHGEALEAMHKGCKVAHSSFTSDEYLQPFYLGEWVPRHVKNSSPLRMAELSRILIGRYEVIETRLHHVYGGRKENFRKTSVPFVRKRK